MVKGKKFTPEQIRLKFGVVNAHDVIYQIRKLGVAVAAKNTKNGTQYSVDK
jgi:hypothetical protein